MAFLKNEILDPVQEFERLQEEINRLFDYERSEPSQGLFDRSFSPLVDILENNDEFVVVCDLPGVSISDLDISIASNVLTIKGEKKPVFGDGGKIFTKETWEGHFQRTLSLPDSVDVNRIEAIMQAGVLKVRLPKKEEVKPRQIQIQAK